MQRILSSYVFSHRKLTPALLGEIERAGINAVELFCLRPHFEYGSPQELRELGDWFRGRKLAVHALHAPTERDSAPGRTGVPISISELERVRRLDAVDEVKRALDAAEFFPFQHFVQHVCSSRESYDPRKWDAAFNSLEHLALFARERGVTIALENTPGVMATPNALRQFVADTRLNVKLCFDTGHAHMDEGVVPGLEAMGDLVATTHLHDNHGDKDEHLLPFEGSIDWPAVLKRMGDSLPIVLELKEAAVPESPLEKISAAFDRLEKALTGAAQPAGT